MTTKNNLHQIPTPIVWATAVVISMVFLSIGLLGFATDNQPDTVKIECVNGGTLSLSGNRATLRGDLHELCNQLDGIDTNAS